MKDVQIVLETSTQEHIVSGERVEHIITQRLIDSLAFYGTSKTVCHGGETTGSAVENNPKLTRIDTYGQLDYKNIMSALSSLLFAWLIKLRKKNTNYRFNAQHN